MDCNVQEEEGWLQVYDQTANGHVYHQDPLRIESQLQNTQKGVGSLL
jgi:hypothetical protein